MPMKARTIHNPDGSIRYQQYGNRNQVIYSIRSDLFKQLIHKSLKNYPSIKVTYEASVKDIDIPKYAIMSC